MRKMSACSAEGKASKECRNHSGTESRITRRNCYVIGLLNKDCEIKFERLWRYQER